MKKIFIILGIAALGLSSCKEFKESDGGMLYNIHTDEGGETIKPGDFVALKAVQKTDQDSVIYNSYDFDQPTFTYGDKPRYSGDFNHALSLLSEGDSVTLKLRVDSIKASVVRTGAPAPNIKGEYMIYILKIVKVIPRENQQDAAFQAKVEEFFKAETAKVMSSEASRIKNYITAHNLKPIVMPSGLNHVVTKPGNGAKAVVGDTVVVNYTGSFLSGTVFDSSLSDVAKKSKIFNPDRPYGPIKVAIGSKTAIAGFEEGLSLFAAGTKVTLIMPSKLAYGPQGSEKFPPYTPLVFEIEVLNIIRP
jgi:FKBP-type peptidyl-prolyl cis-trans isomerase FkpA